MSALLDGVRVLDLTTVVVGPVCTWRLAQYGAEIIKLESPGGDLMRGLGGPSPSGRHSGAYLHMNRGKRNICLDLKKPQSRAALDRLIEWCDVLVCNMRPSALRRLGLDAETVRGQYADKIHCTITGYGEDGPYAGQPAYDSVVQGASGVAGLSLLRDGAPSYVPLLICDHVVGEIAAGAIMAALAGRDRGGTGATLEVPMFETMAGFVLQEHLAQKSFDPPTGPAGDRRLLNPNNRPLRTADGWISVTANTDPQVRAFLTAVGRQELLDDPRFASVAARAENVDEWFAVRGAALSSKTTAEWMALFLAADVAAMPCHTLDSLIEDPHLSAVGMLASESHPEEGAVTAIRSSVIVDRRTLPLQDAARGLGADTAPILSGLGFDEDWIAAAIAAGAAVGGPD
ncbi:CaiB/BaiF CoA transferase family protein [Aureimonas populi]|uniref:CaiB/BaiF CoA transferase family protein n=1 Tax=Aureimonas populi TaxID=1701758 RepID=A0ABW5CQY1_9HYPH|nr:CoA transferase [Aureimonas populi]